MPIRERLFAAAYDSVGRRMERAWLGERRAKLLSAAEGTVLEIGAGTGANLPHYPSVSRLVLTEPSAAMRRKLAAKVVASGLDVTASAAPAGDLPYPDASFDTVVGTLVLCTVPDVDAALGEIRRVLKPGGRLLVMEHVRAEDSRLATWQDRWERPWGWAFVGCHPNRDTAAAVESAGFVWERLERFDAPGPRTIVTPGIEGVARKA